MIVIDGGLKKRWMMMMICSQLDLRRVFITTFFSRLISPFPTYSTLRYHCDRILISRVTMKMHGVLISLTSDAFALDLAAWHCARLQKASMFATNAESAHVLAEGQVHGTSMGPGRNGEAPALPWSLQLTHMSSKDANPLVLGHHMRTHRGVLLNFLRPPCHPEIVDLLGHGIPSSKIEGLAVMAREINPCYCLLVTRILQQ